MAVRVKICGITRVEDAELAAELGADMIGLNFYPPSPRYLGLERAHEIAPAIARRSRIVGVFVNASRDYIEERRREIGLDMIQFHGDEDESELAGWPVPVIRAFRLNAPPPLDLPERTRADYILIDAYHRELFGGTGLALPFRHLEGLDLSRVFISGGLRPGNVAEAVALRPYAVDVASGVEATPGVKDHDKLRSFIANAKSSR